MTYLYKRLMGGMENVYQCPVCGYVGLDEPAYDTHGYGSCEICSCCGFEYGYSEDHDVQLGFVVTSVYLREVAFQLYRKQWIEAGAEVAHLAYIVYYKYIKKRIAKTASQAIVAC